MTTRSCWRSLLAVVVGLGAGVANAQTSVHFEAGSLIIPQDSTFQTSCGSASAYGLIYALLAENKTGGRFGPTNPVTIYWVISQTKKSPNRCVPTNKHAAPTANPHGLAASTLADRWIDGCDMAIPSGLDSARSDTQPPVVNVDYTVTLPRTVASTTTILYDPTVAGSSVVNAATTNYGASQTLDNSGTACPAAASQPPFCTTRFTKVRYQGGPFVIGANDAARVIAAIQDTTSRLNMFATPCATGCTFSAPYTCHYVAMHQAQVSFDAVAYKQITHVPPPLAILQNGAGVKGDMLPKYLTSAGLNFSGAGGCPTGSTVCTSGLNGLIYDTISFPEDTRNMAAFPHGVINRMDPVTHHPYYRTFWMPHWYINGSCNGGDSCTNMANAAADVCDSDVNNTQRACGDRPCKGDNNTTLNVKDILNQACGSTLPWTGTAFTFNGNGTTYASVAAAVTAALQGSGRCAASATDVSNALARILAAYTPTGFSCTVPTSTDIEQTLQNISYFGDQTGQGIFAECAAVGTLEAEQGRIATYYSNAGTPASTTLLNITGLALDTPHFMYTNYVGTNGASTGSNQPNCTDPNFSTGNCLSYPNPGNPFSQIADFTFQPHSGAITSWEPYVGATTTPQSMMKTGVVRLAVAWKDWVDVSASSPTEVFTPAVPSSYKTTTNGGTLAASNMNWDIFTTGSKDGDPNKATILYLGGHQYDGDIAGTRVVLNTLLNLGADPVTSERSATAPVAFDDVNGNLAAGTRALLIDSIFDATSGTLPSNTTSYLAAQGSHFVFPFIAGDLRAHSIVGGSALTSGKNDFNAAVVWSANTQLPTPGARNIFTFVGGTVTANPSLSAGRQAPNGVLQVGWTPLKFDQAEIVAPMTGSTPWLLAKNTGCTDVLRLAQVTEAGVSHLGLVSDANGDGICDLQELFQYSTLNPDASWHIQTADVATMTTDYPVVKNLVSLVRGFCYATVGKVDNVGAFVNEPTVTQCNNPNADNLAHMGGAVSSTAAVVPASPRIPGASGIARPTVAYVGAYDGMLHAIYVSGGAGYTGPNETKSYPSGNASTAFKTDLVPEFNGVGTIPPAGTELWSFLPSTQIPFLKTNEAKLDSSPVVQDVFADFVGNGKREWHTVLVMSVGPSSREIFAMDVTDPLRPVLLWELVGSTYSSSGYPQVASTTAFANSSTGGTSVGYRWNGTYRSGATNNTAYQIRPAGDPGRYDTGLYDYSELGAARSLSVAQLRVGLAPVYAAYVAANSSGLTAAGAPAKGLEVYAIDIATGQKLWHWDHEFLASDTSRVHDNAVPRGVTVRYTAGGAGSLFVGDFDGKVWELDAMTGVNRNFQPSTTTCTGDCNLSAFDTAGSTSSPQPITSNIALAVVPPSPSGDFAQYAGETLLLFGTGGSALVPATVGGGVHALLTSKQYRKPVLSGGFHLDGVTGWTASAAMTDAQATGMLQEPANWPKTFTAPERVYGTITVAGQTAFVPVAGGIVNLDDVLHAPPSATLVGKTYSFDLGAVTGSLSSLSGFSLANFGGVTTYHQDLGGGNVKDVVLTTEVSGVTTKAFTSATGSTALSKNSNLSPATSGGGVTFRLMSWLKRRLSL